MNTRNLILASAIAAAIAGSSMSYANAKPSQEVIEARQESQIWTTYALSPYLRANDLQVSVHEGKATLTGNVAESVNKDLARQIALGVDGIKSVDNKIEVQAKYVAPPQSADRSYGEKIDDATITSTVKSKLLWSRYAGGLTAARRYDARQGHAHGHGRHDGSQGCGGQARDQHARRVVGQQSARGQDREAGPRQGRSQQHGGRLDHDESEVDLHVFDQCGRIRHWREDQRGHRDVERQGG